MPLDGIKGFVPDTGRIIVKAATDKKLIITSFYSDQTVGDLELTRRQSDVMAGTKSAAAPFENVADSILPHF